MVNTKKNPLHKAQSRIEAESWIDSIGKRQYPNEKLIIHRQGNEWHVYKG
jgi:hypothetical protein